MPGGFFSPPPVNMVKGPSKISDIAVPKQHKLISTESRRRASADFVM
jgi:hypothetical protein